MLLLRYIGCTVICTFLSLFIFIFITPPQISNTQRQNPYTHASHFNVNQPNDINCLSNLGIPVEPLTRNKIFCIWYLTELQAIKRSNILTLSIKFASLTVALGRFLTPIDGKCYPVPKLSWISNSPTLHHSL